MPQFTDIEERAWTGLVRARQAVMEGVEGELKRRGFPPLAWCDALLELERAGEGRLRLSELARRMVLKKYNLSRLLDRMEGEGLVRRAACPGDRRGAYAAITPRGRALRRRMWPAYHAAVERHLLSRLARRDLEALAAACQRLLRGAAS